MSGDHAEPRPRRAGVAGHNGSSAQFCVLVQWYEVKRVIEEKSEEKRAETVM